MQIKKHFIREKHRPICKNIIDVGGKPIECIFLRGKDNAHYECLALGFRSKPAIAIHGRCRKDGWRVQYDSKLLNHEKSKAVNFCLYRLLGPIVLVISIIGIPYILQKLFDVVLNLIRI